MHRIGTYKSYEEHKNSKKGNRVMFLMALKGRLRFLEKHLNKIMFEKGKTNDLIRRIEEDLKTNPSNRAEIYKMRKLFKKKQSDNQSRKKR